MTPPWYPPLSPVSPPLSPVTPALVPAPLTCDHDGPDVGLAQLVDDRRRLRLERVLEDEESEEEQLALHPVPAQHDTELQEEEQLTLHPVPTQHDTELQEEEQLALHLIPAQHNTELQEEEQLTLHPIPTQHDTELQEEEQLALHLIPAQHNTELQEEEQLALYTVPTQHNTELQEEEQLALHPVPAEEDTTEVQDETTSLSARSVHNVRKQMGCCDTLSRFLWGLASHLQAFRPSLIPAPPTGKLHPARLHPRPLVNSGQVSPVKCNASPEPAAQGSPVLVQCRPAPRKPILTRSTLNQPCATVARRGTKVTTFRPNAVARNSKHHKAFTAEF